MMWMFKDVSKFNSSRTWSGCAAERSRQVFSYSVSAEKAIGIVPQCSLARDNDKSQAT